MRDAGQPLCAWSAYDLQECSCGAAALHPRLQCAMPCVCLQGLMALPPLAGFGALLALTVLASTVYTPSQIIADAAVMAASTHVRRGGLQGCKCGHWAVSCGKHARLAFWRLGYA